MISRNRLQRDDARAFLEGFFNECNHLHRHSGIAWYTPAAVRFGTAEAVDEACQIALNDAYLANPVRFSRRPRPPEMPTVFFINEPVAESQIN